MNVLVFSVTDFDAATASGKSSAVMATMNSEIPSMATSHPNPRRSISPNSSPNWSCGVPSSNSARM